ncbi:MAG: hypothetical protein HOO10_11205 [Candidatus Marinimicrobia bacterium]|nr:hypothetical protein [Candidatus Neomarinimicrobiota bacterium]
MLRNIKLNFNIMAEKKTLPPLPPVIVANIEASRAARQEKGPWVEAAGKEVADLGPQDIIYPGQGGGMEIDSKEVVNLLVTEVGRLLDEAAREGRIDSPGSGKLLDDVCRLTRLSGEQILEALDGLGVGINTLIEDDRGSGSAEVD